METTNISLKQLVHSTQDALSKEQNLVKSFQEQLQDNKVKIFDVRLLFCCFDLNSTVFGSIFLFVFQFCVLGR